MSNGKFLSSGPDVRAVHHLQEHILRRFHVDVEFADALKAAKRYPRDPEAAEREALAEALGRISRRKSAGEKG